MDDEADKRIAEDGNLFSKLRRLMVATTEQCETLTY